MFDWNKKGLIEEVKDLIARVENSNEVNNDKWITVHPGGNEDAKGVHVLVKEGETEKDAIERLEKKQDKSDKGEDANSNNYLYKKAKEIGDDKTKLLKRLKEGLSVLNPEYKKEFKDYELDFENKTLKSKTSDYVLQWENNGRTSEGSVSLRKNKKADTTKGGEEPQKMSFADYQKSSRIDEKIYKERTKDLINPDGTLKVDKKETTLYDKFVNNPRTVKTLIDSIKAAQYENPDAKVGDTVLESDRIISLFTDDLTPEEYKNFNFDKAEKALFKKLNELEKDVFGFKSDNSLTNTIAEAMAEVIAENIK